MALKRKLPWALLIGFTVAVFFTILALLVIRQADRSRSSMPVFGKVPAFEFTERSGEYFVGDDMSGKINVVDFIFTRCRGACPVMNRAMRPLYQLYADYVEVQFVSISVDPEYDTPEVLREYAIRQGVTDNRWVFLHGPIERVVWVSEDVFMLPADELPMGHSTKFVLVDQKGQIRGYYDSYNETCIKNLKMHIRELYRSGS
jgi:protein SCO1/2